ncbi:MAG: cytochrome c oxidase accessory protein CcoG [Ignavibacteriae bacterium]|nr:cytochrome c oxidase accessory protein CcoG [Ignavibacteriota bacterium]
MTSSEQSGPGPEGSFRDSLGIVSQEGKRRWLFPKAPSGRFHRARIAMSALLLLILFGIPFIKIGNHPFFLFNFLQRKLILFGTVFGPHDFYLVGLSVITGIIFIILFTVVFGRLFCGWICPQTVFMEMVFRKIDYFVEGDHREQARLRASSWNGKKLFRKSVKYAIYAAVSFLIANTLLAYVVGIDELGKLVSEPPANNIGLFTAVVGFSVVFYWIFSWFREQACILVCPYGRLQGVLLDRNSIVIAYDHVRGEPRGKLRRDQVRQEGDCIDCHQCVDVCPTGIDIRNGTQLECVNCTACIDACDTIMDGIKKPRGLIRYASANGITQGAGFRWTARVIGYTAVLAVLIAVLTILLIRRTPLDVTVLRTPGMMFQELPDDRISNVYDLKVLNKMFNDVPVTLRLLEPAGEVEIVGGPLVAPSQGVMQSKVLVVLPQDGIRRMSTPITIGIFADTVLIQRIATTFLGPVKHKKDADHEHEGGHE